MDKQQLLYNRAIDNLSYLVLNYSKPIQELLALHNIFFKGNPSKKQLINEIVEQIKLENKHFISSLEKLMTTMDEEIEKIKSELISEREYEKVKNQFEK